MLIIQVALASVTVALKVRDGGPKTPYRWPYRAEIYNNGLWDVLHFAGNPKPHVSADNYRQALLTIYEKLSERYPRAAVVFAATTVVSEDLQKTASYRRNEEIAENNDLARSALVDKIDAVDDLYSVSLDLGDEYRAKDGLHYNEDGARYLAEAVCRFLKDHKYI